MRGYLQDTTRVAGERSEVRPNFLDAVRTDTAYAFRSLRRSRAFTFIAVPTLALGIGASVTMFSVLYGVLLRELPVRAASDLVVLWTAAPARSTDHLPVQYSDLVSFGERTRSFESLAGVAYQGAVEQVLLDAGEPLRVAATWVTGEFFPVLGVAAARGRMLRPDDDAPGAAPVMVISHGFWQRQFGGDPTAVGRTLQWNGRATTIVGIVPAGFEFPRGVDVWTPVLPAFPATREAGASPAEIMVFDLVGRLAPGAGPTAAAQEFAAYLRETDAQRPQALRGQQPVVTPLPDVLRGDVRQTLWLGAAAVALLLLIACVNVANLLLIRGAGRSRELAVRSALGAGRRRIVGQLMTESLVLAVIAGALGIGLAHMALSTLVSLAPTELPQRELIRLDVGVLLFALGATLATAVLAGALPAVLTAAGDVTSRLRAGRGNSPDPGGTALRHALVIGQVSLAILVVSGAGLLLRSLVTLQSVDMGFNRDRLLVIDALLPAHVRPDRPQQVQLQEDVVARIGALPGVVSAAALPRPPFAGEGGWTAMYSGEGQSAEVQATNPWVNFEVVGPEYFATMEIPVRGRGFDARDREDAARVAVISEAVARHTWPGEEALGRRIRLGPPDGPGEWHTIVGVVPETRYRELAQPQPTLYLPVRQFGGPVPLSLAVRTHGEPTALLAEIRSVLRAAHPELAIVGGGSLRQLMAGPLARPRFSALLLTAFGTLTLLLALVGIYAALAASVRQRTREVGVRLALGARAADVRNLILGQGLRLALAGCALGTAGGLLTARLLSDMLFGVEPHDPVTFVAIVGLVLATAALACYAPARRASRVDPMETLRAE